MLRNVQVRSPEYPYLERNLSWWRACSLHHHAIHGQRQPIGLPQAEQKELGHPSWGCWWWRIWSKLDYHEKISPISPPAVVLVKSFFFFFFLCNNCYYFGNIYCIGKNIFAKWNTKIAGLSEILLLFAIRYLKVLLLFCIRWRVFISNWWICAFKLPREWSILQWWTLYTEIWQPETACKWANVNYHSSENLAPFTHMKKMGTFYCLSCKLAPFHTC